MTTYLSKSVLGTGPIFLALLIFFAGPAFAQVVGERVERGPYALQRSQGPQQLVVGVALPELTQAHFPEMNTTQIRLRGQWGRAQTLFRQEDKAQVRVTVAVYASVAEAEDAALELLADTSARMEPGSRRGGAIGTHSWYLASPGGQGTVVFVYGNSLFQVFSSSYELAEASARKILADLVGGTNGIRLGRQVALPTVTDIRLPSELKAGAEVAVTLEGSDPEARGLSFFGRSSTGQLLETAESKEKIFIPAAGAGEIRIYAINDLNVVSPVYVRKVEAGQEE